MVALVWWIMRQSSRATAVEVSVVLGARTVAASRRRTDAMEWLISCVGMAIPPRFPEARGLFPGQLA